MEPDKEEIGCRFRSYRWSASNRRRREWL